MNQEVFAALADALERGEAVKLSGFGNFQLRDKPQRPGRNPKTGEKIKIAARKVPAFVAGKALKEAIGGARSSGAKKSAAKKSGAKKKTVRR